MLFRRSKWTKQFLEAVAELGRVPEPELGEVRPLLRSAQVHAWEVRVDLWPCLYMMPTSCVRPLVADEHTGM